MIYLKWTIKKKTTLFYQVNTLMSRLQIIPNRCFHELLSHWAPRQVRGSHLFKTQQKNTISCAIHVDTTVMNREVILSTAAKWRSFFQHELPTGNTASSFSALMQQSQRQTWQPVTPGSDSRSPPGQQQKFLCFRWEEDKVPKELTVQLPLYLFTPGPAWLFTASYPIFPLPILSWTVGTEKSPCMFVIKWGAYSI